MVKYIMVKIKYKEEGAALNHYQNNINYFDKSKYINAAISTDTFKKILADFAISLNYVNVFDVGCGTGLLEKFILHNFIPKKILGIDYSKNRINKAIEQCNICKNSVEFTCEDINFAIDRLIKDQVKFEVIFAFEVLEHLLHPEKVMKSLKKLLSPTGIIVGTMPVQEKTNNIHLSAYSSPDKIENNLKVRVYDKYETRFKYQYIFIYRNNG